MKDLLSEQIGVQKTAKIDEAQKEWEIIFNVIEEGISIHEEVLGSHLQMSEIIRQVSSIKKLAQISPGETLRVLKGFFNK